MKPDFPNRLKFCGMGIVAGLALGCLVVFLLEFFDDRIYGEKELKALLPITVMAEIPEIQSPVDEVKAEEAGGPGLGNGSDHWRSHSGWVYVQLFTRIVQRYPCTRAFTT